MISNNRRVARIAGLLLVASILLLGAQSALANPFLIKGAELRPYLIGQAAWGQLAENIFTTSIEDSYWRVGGGFGVEYGRYLAEITYFTGQESWINGMAFTGYETPIGDSRFLTQELHLKLAASPLHNRFKLPVGVVAGYMTFTTSNLDDSGYDLKNNGWYIGPYAGATYQINRWVGFGIEVEYHIGLQNSQPGPEDYYNRYSGDVSLYPWTPEGMSYFENAGFFNSGTNDSSNRGGYLINFRTVIYLPEF